MRFVNNDSVVLHQQAVLLDLCQQDTVGHQFDHRVITDVIAESDFIPDATARLRFQLFRDPVRHRSCRQTTRLGMADQPFNPAPQLHTDFR